MSHPTNKKEALIPLKFMKKPSTPINFLKMVCPPLKIINMVCTHPKIKGPVYEGGKIIKFYVKFGKNFMLGFSRRIKSECLGKLPKTYFIGPNLQINKYL